MTAGSEFAIYAVLASYDFSGCRNIVDVGRGHGRLLSMILAKAPNARGVLYDLPTVVDGAGPELTKAGVADRPAWSTGRSSTRFPRAATPTS